MKPANEDTRRIRRAQLAALATDPLKFITLCWPQMCLYEKQLEVLQSVCHNVETFVHAAHKTGKTRIAAIAALWFYASRTPARVVISSSSESQLRNILWSEIRQLIEQSAVPFPFVIRDLSIRKRRRPDGQEPIAKDQLLGQVTQMVESFQGYHLPSDKPRVLAVFDEASAVSNEFYEAAQSWGHRILVIGNPLTTDNFFYARCKQGDVADPASEEGLLRHVIHIDGRDVPNVQMGTRWNAKGRTEAPPVLIPGLLTYQEFLRREVEWDEVMRTTRLHGRFYEGAYQFLFPGPVLDVAMDRRRWDDLNQRSRRAEAMGVDVAMGGRDRTCWTVVDRFGVIEQITRDIKSSMEIVGLTIELIRKHDLLPQRVAFDAGGGGKQIVDRLVEQRYYYIKSVHFGESASDKQAYVNRRAEMYGTLSELLDLEREEGVFALPPESGQLRAELNILPLRYDSEGRLVLPPKDAGRTGQSQEKTIRQLLGRSPDRADSLVLAAWVLVQALKVPDYSGYVFDDDDGELTPEEVAAMPEELREIYEMDLWDRPVRRNRRPVDVDDFIDVW